MNCDQPRFIKYLIQANGARMLNPDELHRVYHQGYLPEHLPDYVEAISGAESYLLENRLCYLRKKHLLFIGYPFGADHRHNPQAYQTACDRFQPSTAAIIAPEIWELTDSFEEQPADVYYRLNLPVGTPAPGVAYMIRRAEKELTVHMGQFGKEHRKLIKSFIAGQAFNARQKYVFKNVQRYLERSTTSRLLEVRKKGLLAAFTIVDLGSADSAYYLFNFRAAKVPVPGATDLLFSEMVNLAQAEGKKAINLGLGINAGIRRFKEKWGGAPFLPYASALVHRGPLDLGSLVQKL